MFLVSARHISTVTLAASNSAKAGGGIGYGESRGEEKTHEERVEMMKFTIFTYVYTFVFQKNPIHQEKNVNGSIW